jgi:hypothetical protein
MMVVINVSGARWHGVTSPNCCNGISHQRLFECFYHVRWLQKLEAHVNLMNSRKKIPENLTANLLPLSDLMSSSSGTLLVYILIYKSRPLRPC